MLDITKLQFGLFISASSSYNNHSKAFSEVITHRLLAKVIGAVHPGPQRDQHVTGGLLARARRQVKGSLFFLHSDKKLFKCNYCLTHINQFLGLK